MCEEQDSDGAVKPAEMQTHPNVRMRDSRGTTKLCARVSPPHAATTDARGQERQQQAARHEISARAPWENHGEQWFRQKRTHQARAQQYREQRDESKIQNQHVEKFSQWLNGREVQRIGRLLSEQTTPSHRQPLTSGWTTSSKSERSGPAGRGGNLVAWEST